MKLSIQINSSEDLATKEDMAAMLRQIATALENTPYDYLQCPLSDSKQVRVGHMSLTGVPPNEPARPH